MAYATLDDLTRLASTERLIQLTDRAWPAAGVIDGAVVDAALEDATAICDSYLGARYPVPLADPPAVVRRACAVIAYHALHIEQAPDKVAADHERMIQWLRDVAAGRASVPVVTGGDSVAQPATDLRVSGPARVFSRDSLAV